MLFGLFGKKSNKEKLLEKGKNLASRGRAGEAMTYFEDVLDIDPDCGEAKALIAECRSHLVALNISESEALKEIDPERAVEHARLALELAGNDRELAKKAGDAVSRLAKAAPKKEVKKEEPKKRLFEPSCGSASCGSSCAEEGEGGDFHEDPDDLYFFYLESADEEEKDAFEEMGASFRRAYVALHQGDAEEAGRMLGKAKAEEGNKMGIFYLAGLLAWQKSDGKTADRLLYEAVKADPNFGPAVKRRAMLLRDMRLPAEAAKVLAQRVESVPDDKEALTIYATSLAEAGRAAEAAEIFGPYATETMKTNPNVANIWGHILLGAGRADEAVVAFRTAVTLQPDNLEAQEMLGIQLTRRGGRDAEGAVKAFKHCYRVNPDRGWYYLLRIADAYRSMGRAKEAGEFLEEAQKELPDTDEARNAWETVAGLLAGKN